MIRNSKNHALASDSEEMGVGPACASHARLAQSRIDFYINLGPFLKMHDYSNGLVTPDLSLFG